MLAPRRALKGVLSRVPAATETTAESLWEKVLGRLKDTLNEATFQNWFGEAEAGGLGEGVFTVVVPNDFTREWIEEHFLAFLRSVASEAYGAELRVAFRVREEPARPEPVPFGEERARTETVGPNPKYTFDRFVICSSNRF